jgi:hypothetical protein
VRSAALAGAAKRETRRNAQGVCRGADIIEARPDEQTMEIVAGFQNHPQPKSCLRIQYDLIRLIELVRAKMNRNIVHRDGRLFQQMAPIEIWKGVSAFSRNGT